MSNFTEVNKSHWNKTAATYNSTNEKTANQLIEEIQKRKDWIGVDWVEESSSSEDENKEAQLFKPLQSKRSVRLLDYACGTGMISRALGPYITSSIGIDLSENMVEVYNTQASNQGLSPSEMHAYVGNLLDPSNPSPEHLSGPEFFDFDIAVVGLGFHHFEDPVFAATQLGKRLKKGGVLMLVDFVTHAPHGSHIGHEHNHGHGHGHHHHGHSHSHVPASTDSKTQEVKEESKPDLTEKEKQIAATVKHFGFSKEGMQKYLEEGGVGGDFGYDVIEKDVVFKMETRTMVRKVFLCRGTKV